MPGDRLPPGGGARLGGAPPRRGALGRLLRHRLTAPVAAATAVLVATGAAVFATGYDVKKTPLEDGSVWVLQSGDGNRYARVNTTLGELDAVKTAPRPTALAQHADAALLFAQNNERVARIDPARPADLNDDDAAFAGTPSGTTSISAEGEWIGYLTAEGQVFAGRIDGSADAAASVDPGAGIAATDDPQQPTEQYRAAAIAVTENGRLFSYSPGSGAVLEYDIAEERVVAEHAVPDAPGAIPGSDAAEGTDDGGAAGPTGQSGLQLSVAGDRWLLLDSATARLWVSTLPQPIETGLGVGAMLQDASPDRARALVADTASLLEVQLDSGTLATVFGGAGRLGAPASPIVVGAERYAAWLPMAGAGGVLWSSVAGPSTGDTQGRPSASEGGTGAERRLDYAGATPPLEPTPVFQRNGGTVVLNDVRSGWTWTVPDGRLVAGSQRWSLDSDQREERADDAEQVAEITDPRPPVAEPDVFGARPGRLTLLPVLLNDHDANGDVLTIAADSLTRLPAEFGEVSLVADQQAVALRLAPGAQGSATFSYAVTDGTRADGLRSEPATVTVHARGDEENGAPQWCGVDSASAEASGAAGVAECLLDWPEPQLRAGGTVRVPVLHGWVDPDGDPVYLHSAVNQSGVGSVTTTPDGRVVYQHPDPSASDPISVTIVVRVSDSRGAIAERPLVMQVSPVPELTAEPFALASVVGRTLTVDPMPHISGESGPVAIASASVPDSAAAAASVTVNRGSRTFDFTAREPGSYLVSYVVGDGVSELVAQARITVDADAGALTTAPVTVFVRPKTDTSVDVFSAVSNPAGRVLLLSQAVTETASGASLDVDVVGQAMLRVRGSTADGQPGLLGVVRYTVSDGSGDAAFTTEGEATVVLLPAPVPQAPIAVEDAVTVRAGAQVDIRVLANDVAPDGNVLVLHPESIERVGADGSGSSGSGDPESAGLAFAAGETLRYLAPSEPGTYTLRYGVSVAGAPHLADTADVTVTVLPHGENRAPRPRTLVGRVLAGETVELPFSAFGVDPDGDSVKLDRIVSQPDAGTATISPTATSIRYTSVRGQRGEVQFEYRVRDRHGATGVAIARIGVLDEQSDPSPVTFSDYYEVVAGEGNRVVVEPTANDLDPTGGELTLLSVVPDAAMGTDEYQQALAQLGVIDDGRVELLAGETPGIRSFVYTAENERGDVAAGLIVLRAVREAVPQYPIVADTVVSFEQRGDFASGIDVVSGKVSWSAGDLTELRLRVLDTAAGDAAGVAVDGWRISGTAPDEGLLLPFAVTGTAFDGTEMTTYGFLRIAATSEIVLALKSDFAPLTVDEGESLVFDMADLVAYPAGERLELARDGVRPSGQRAGARCAGSSGTRVEYRAGQGAPWSDSCTVPVRLNGQTEYTDLVVPLTVVPPEPQPELRPASLTHSPAATPIEYDLRQMVEWNGREDWQSLRFIAEYSGDQFTVEQRGATLVLSALDTASPGRENTVAVRLPSHPAAAPALITLKVGPAPTELPKGGTTARECRASEGTSCLIDVIGAPGEANLYRSTPLQLASVEPGTCPGVTFSVADSRRVKATWMPGAPGATCETSFVVRDAQGKVSAGERNGSVTVDLLGYPKAPASVSQVGFDASTVTLAVAPGEASAAYPALQGFALYNGSRQVGTCSTSGNCDPIPGERYDNRQRYTARAVNAIGESQATGAIEAWTYVAPTVGAVAAESRYDSSATTASSGSVELRIAQSEPRADRYAISGAAGAPAEVRAERRGETTVRFTLAPGSHELTVTPLSDFPLPPGRAPSASTATVTVRAVGSPLIDAAGVSFSTTENSITVRGVTFGRNSSDRPDEVRYIATQSGIASCTVGRDGTGLQATAAGQVSTSPTIGSLAKHRSYTVIACYSNGYGVAQQTLGTATTWVAPPAPGDSTYRYTVTDRGDRYTIDQPTAATAPPQGFDAVFENYDGGSTVWGRDPGIRVKYCLEGDLTRCGPTSAVTPVQADRAWQVRMPQVDVTCRVSAPAGIALSLTGGEASLAAATLTAFEAYVPDAEGGGAWVAGTDASTWPAGATRVRNVQWNLAWTAAAVQGLDDKAGTIAAEVACAP
ncbi:Ig-like domain-containing protein [Ruicaihuangia caeni]|uniref:Ig-like domain-containing protein n=1 Tax=Ruicaihuangia caeni TaxID=3042517 RepID=A0AAW6T400_9MICO|nr:Ig-like domain-containing protein [Klugiella sp. YN-L-19]MDI2098540.1 Ig-like domain-containing protein [Klugiella sp. YN-L-19]